MWTLPQALVGRNETGVVLGARRSERRSGYRRAGCVHVGSLSVKDGTRSGPSPAALSLCCPGRHGGQQRGHEGPAGKLRAAGPWPRSQSP